MYKYKILLNGMGGYYFSSLIKKDIIDYWLDKKSLQLLEEYILSQYMQDEEIDEEWRIPEKYRFDIFSNIKSTCLWETDSIDYNNNTICDIYKLLSNNDNLTDFVTESDFYKHKLINSFLFSEQTPMFENKNNWNALIQDVLHKNSLESAYIVYFKINARGYATHDEILHLEEHINIENLKFFTKDFGVDKVKGSVIKKAIYNANTKDEKVLYDFHMLDSARENIDYNFIGLQKVITTKNKLLLNWIKN